MTSDLPVKGFIDALDLFQAYRVDEVHGGQVITARLRDDVDPESERVRRLLHDWPGPHDLRSGPQGWHVILYRPTRPPRERWWLHALLLALTLASTIVAGSLLSGRHPLGFVELPLVGGWWLPVPAIVYPDALLAGLPFGLVLIVILALHESGHYVTARYHEISVTPPFFIPFPPYVSIIGTLGAFIRLRSPVTDRDALLDVGAAGPLMSFIASLPALWWGFVHSRIAAGPPGPPAHYVVRFMSEEIWIGGSLAFSALGRWTTGFTGGGTVLLLHPVAFAGWIGLFVTALNLLPISQLDGGHILYGLLGDRQRPLAWLFFGALIPLGYYWAGWWVWGALIFIVGRGRLHHPPVFNARRGVTRGRVVVGLAAFAIFVLCFVPVPFRL